MIVYTPGIRLHGTGVGTKNADVDKISRNKVGICKRSFLKHNKYCKCGHRNVLAKRQVWMSIFHSVFCKGHTL